MAKLSTLQHIYIYIYICSTPQCVGTIWALRCEEAEKKTTRAKDGKDERNKKRRNMIYNHPKGGCEFWVLLLKNWVKK